MTHEIKEIFRNEHDVLWYLFRSMLSNVESRLRRFLSLGDLGLNFTQLVERFFFLSFSTLGSLGSTRPVVFANNLVITFMELFPKKSV